MGMLQLAGAVSGFGKGLQQGLQQTQQFMGQSMLMKEREEMEMKRLQLTFANERGLLQERAKIDSDAADKRYSRDLDLEDMREDAALRRERIGRDAARTDEATKYERQKERDAKAQENAVTNKVLDASYEQQKDATKAKQERAKEERDRTAADRKFQQDAGLRLTEKTMDLQKPHGGSSSTNPELNNQFKVLTDEIKGLEHMIANEFDTGKRKKLQDDLEKKLAERRVLANLPSTQKERKPIIFPE